MQNAAVETRYKREYNDTANRQFWSAVTMVPLDDWRKLSVITCCTYTPYTHRGAALCYVPAGVIETLVSCFDAGDCFGQILHHRERPKPRRVTKETIQQQHDEVLAELDGFMRMAEKLPVRYVEPPRF